MWKFTFCVMIEAHRKKDWDIEAIFLGGLRFKQCSVSSISADLPGGGSGVNKCQIGVPHRTRCSNTQKWWIAAYSAACNETKQHLAVGEAPLFAVSKKEGRIRVGLSVAVSGSAVRTPNMDFFPSVWVDKALLSYVAINRSGSLSLSRCCFSFFLVRRRTSEWKKKKNFLPAAGAVASITTEWLYTIIEKTQGHLNDKDVGVFLFFTNIYYSMWNMRFYSCDSGRYFI